MAQLIPVDHDPYSDPPISLVPVDHDPFATPKPGKTVPPLTSNALQAYPRQLTGAAWRMSGLGDVSDALSRGASWPEVVGAAVPAAMGAIQPEARGIGAAEEALAPAVERGITAYHGSPYDFDRFDLSKIGTGEGAQAYGHGLYFAENPATAQAYRDALAGNPAMGRGILRKGGVEGSPYDPDDPQHVAALYAYQNGSAAKGAKALLAESAFGFDKNRQPIVDQALNLLRSGNAPKFDPNFDPGRMYQVSINADPSHFLDWDKPLSEQSPTIQKTIANVPGLSPYLDIQRTAGYGDTGAGIHKALESYFWEKNLQAAGRDPASVHPDEVGAMSTSAMQNIRDLGIPGIKYLDQGSRGSGQGTSNYVVFDDKLIDIVKKYGIAGLIGGGAAHFSTVPVDHDPYGASQ